MLEPKLHFVFRIFQGLVYLVLAEPVLLLHLIHRHLFLPKQSEFIAKDSVSILETMSAATWRFLILYNLRNLFFEKVVEAGQQLLILHLVIVEVIVCFKNIVLVLFRYWLKRDPVARVLLLLPRNSDGVPELFHVVSNLSGDIPMGVSVKISSPLVSDIILFYSGHHSHVADLDKIIDFTLRGVLIGVLFHNPILLCGYLSHLSDTVLKDLIYVLF